MRPIKLTVTGFGPYAGRQEIDFSRLGESGLYRLAYVIGPDGEVIEFFQKK